MVKSFFLTDLNEKKYLLNKFMYKKLKDGYLVTTDHGGWLFLSSEDFFNLRRNKLIFGSSLF